MIIHYVLYNQKLALERQKYDKKKIPEVYKIAKRV